MASISAKAFKLAAMVSSVGVYHALSSGCRPLLDSKQSLDTSKLDPEPDELWATPPPSLRESAEDMLKQFSQSAVEFCGFVDRSPSVYHAVEEVNRRLRLQGFQRLREQDAWSGQVQPGGKYYVVRDSTSGASVVAFAVGKLWIPGNPFAMVATHVDSPCLKLKPVSRRYRHPFLLAGVQTYGGGLWHSWFDRDLSVAGRVMIRTSSGFIESRLVDIGRPILRVPNLAVHYDQQNPFKYNTELDLLPVAGMMSNVGLIQQVQHKALDSSNGLPHSPSVSEFPAIGPSVNPHQAISSAFNGHGAIATIVAESLSVRLEDVVDFDLSLYDTQKAAIGGENSEFIFASRIDNLMMTFCAVEAFTRSLSEPDSLENESSVRLLAMFDSEEISSRTTHGGRSSFLINTLRRITNETRENIARKSDFEQSMAKSFLISADMLHATHPHLASWHETNHSCLMNSGLVFASDSGRDFTKNTPGEVFVKEIISHGGLPYPGMTFNYQILTPPNNVNCGTTLGPILSMKLGVRTVDIGNAQLSMHSIREMAGTWDVEHAIRYLHLFFERFSVVNGMINVG